MMALYVASHYKNSPNDLQLMADAPAHHLFVLLGMDQIDLRTHQFYIYDNTVISTNLCS
jgi:tRNA(Met) C34 N-acetyltransferase TmcA